MIWDLHTHLTRAFRGPTPAEKAAHLIEIGARHGIDRFCTYMGIEWRREPDPDDFEQQNSQILEAATAHPGKIYGFVYLNPQHTARSLDEMKRCLRDGPMVGVKLWVAHRCSAPELDPIIALATELKAPVFQHTWQKTTGNFPGESTPDDLAQLARRHPEAKLICGHTGGNWEISLPAIREFPHVWTDLAGSDPTAGFTEAAVRELGAGRVLYGSDVPGRSFASQLAKVTGAAISGADKALILGENLRQLIQPIAAAKGLPV